MPQCPIKFMNQDCNINIQRLYRDIKYERKEIKSSIPKKSVSANNSPYPLNAVVIQITIRRNGSFNIIGIAEKESFFPLAINKSQWMLGIRSQSPLESQRRSFPMNDSALIRATRPKSYTARIYVRGETAQKRSALRFTMLSVVKCSLGVRSIPFSV